MVFILIDYKDKLFKLRIESDIRRLTDAEQKTLSKLIEWYDNDSNTLKEFELN